MPNVDNNYSELPQELWLKIVSLLDEPEDLFNFSQTCRVGYAIAQEESLWQEMNNRYDVQNAPISTEKNKFFEFYNTFHNRILRGIKVIEKNITIANEVQKDSLFSDKKLEPAIAASTKNQQSITSKEKVIFAPTEYRVETKKEAPEESHDSLLSKRSPKQTIDEIAPPAKKVKIATPLFDHEAPEESHDSLLCKRSPKQTIDKIAPLAKKMKMTTPLFDAVIVNNAAPVVAAASQKVSNLDSSMVSYTDEMHAELNTLKNAAKLMHFLENASYQGTSYILLKLKMHDKLCHKPLALLAQLHNKYGFKKAVEIAAECFKVREEDIKLSHNNTCDRVQIANIGIFLQNILSSLEVPKKHVRRNSL